MSRARLAARGMAVLLLAAAALAAAPGAEAATARSLAITAATARPAAAFQAFDGNPPKLFDLDGDGRKEIVAQNDNQRVYVFHSGTGALLAELGTTFPPGWQARSFNGPEAYREGNVSRLVVANSAAVVTSWRLDAAASNQTRLAFVKEWERRTTDCHSNPGMDAKPVLADLDRDGRLDIVVATEEVGVVALRSSGTLLWRSCIGGGNAEPAVADLDLDGWPEVVHASDAGVVSALDGRSGAAAWTFRALDHFALGSASMPVGPGIGQLDGVGGPDVVVGARDSHDAANFTNDHAMLIALSSTGALLWGRQDPAGNPLTYTRPIVADAEGDGRNEVYWADWNTVGHNPPTDPAQAWKVTGPANFYRYDHLGNRVWKQVLGTYWSNKDLALADVDGDGRQEVLANGPAAGGHDGIWSLDAATGAKEAFADLYPWMATRAPVLADLAGTGTMQWVVEAGPMATSQGPAVLVYDTGVPYSAFWPGLPHPAPGTPPPPPAGSFNATFTIKSPNAWWQEVTVAPESPRALAKVEVRIAGGAWRPMSKSSWGAWTSSYNAPAGAKVEFLATDAGNAAAQSLPFTWLDGTLSKGSTAPSAPADPDFDAGFSVPSGVNEWWVEVAVQANAPVAAVEAKAGSGAWTPLAKQGWGTWAKSFNVPAGTPVQFRATSSTGATDLSQTFAWLAASGTTTTTASPSPTPTSSPTSSSGSPTGSPSPAPFSATFQPQAVGNDWWIEAKVTSAQAVAKVEASRDGGAWVPLDRTSWGTWAKSVHAPDGTAVTFRATSASGATATSAPIPWT